MDNRKKTLYIDTPCTCSHDMVTFGPLTAEICWRVWGTAKVCKFQRVSRLDRVTARHSSSERQPNFAALNRGRHLYSAGRPSRWVLAHILVETCFATYQVSRTLPLPYIQSITDDALIHHVRLEASADCGNVRHVQQILFHGWIKSRGAI